MPDELNPLSDTTYITEHLFLSAAMNYLPNSVLIFFCNMDQLKRISLYFKYLDHADCGLFKINLRVSNLC
jgi:hypothetical protein